MTGPTYPTPRRIAAVATGLARRSADAMEDFLMEAATVYGLTPDEAWAVLLETNRWALARAQPATTHGGDDVRS